MLLRRLGFALITFVIFATLLSPSFATRQSPRLRIYAGTKERAQHIHFSVHDIDAKRGQCPAQNLFCDELCCQGRCCSADFPFCLSAASGPLRTLCSNSDGKIQCGSDEEIGTPCFAAASEGESLCCPLEPYTRCTATAPFACVTKEGLIGCGEDNKPGVVCPDIPDTCCADPDRCCEDRCCRDGEDGLPRDVEALGVPEPATTPMPPSESPEMEVSASPAIGEEGTCFPANAITELEDGTYKRMDQLQTGDRVRVSKEEFSTIFMWTHRDSEWSGEHFVELITEDQHKLVATVGHIVHVCPALRTECGKETAMIENIEIGDGIFVIEDGDERIMRVQRKKRVRSKGLYNPQTLHGDIVVNGVLASCYTKYIPIRYAHGLLAPLRGCFGLIGTFLVGVERYIPEALHNHFRLLMDHGGSVEL